MLHKTHVQQNVTRDIPVKVSSKITPYSYHNLFITVYILLESKRPLTLFKMLIFIAITQDTLIQFMYNIEELPWLQTVFLILDPGIGIHYHVI